MVLYPESNASAICLIVAQQSGGIAIPPALRELVSVANTTMLLLSPCREIRLVVPGDRLPAPPRERTPIIYHKTTPGLNRVAAPECPLW